MPPIPTRPRKRRAQGGLTRSAVYPPNLLFQRGGLVLPLPDSVHDRNTPRCGGGGTVNAKVCCYPYPHSYEAGWAHLWA